MFSSDTSGTPAPAIDAVAEAFGWLESEAGFERVGSEHPASWTKARYRRENVDVVVIATWRGDVIVHAERDDEMGVRRRVYLDALSSGPGPRRRPVLDGDAARVRDNVEGAAQDWRESSGALLRGDWSGTEELFTYDLIGSAYVHAHTRAAWAIGYSLAPDAFAGAANDGHTVYVGFTQRPAERLAAVRAVLDDEELGTFHALYANNELLAISKQVEQAVLEEPGAVSLGIDAAWSNCIRVGVTDITSPVVALLQARFGEAVDVFVDKTEKM